MYQAVDLTNITITYASTPAASNLGCYAEATKGRALSLASQANNSMSISACIAFCAGKNAKYAGVEVRPSSLHNLPDLTSMAQNARVCRRPDLLLPAD